MADREVKDWITVNGKHIPIYEGETKQTAMERHRKEMADKYIKEKEAQQSKSKEQADKLNKEETIKDIDKHKQLQLDIIKKTNPMQDEYHTGIRKKSDIQTFEEAYKNKERDDSLVYPDFTEKDVKEAIKNGYITVYSSNDIKNGSFVSTSKMMAQDYAGDGKVKMMKVELDDIAWINLDEGQVAMVKPKK